MWISPPSLKSYLEGFFQYPSSVFPSHPPDILIRPLGIIDINFWENGTFLDLHQVDLSLDGRILQLSGPPSNLSFERLPLRYGH